MPLSKRDYESLASFRYVLRSFLRFSEQAAGEMGLSPSQHQALLAIQGYPGRSQVTVKELSERLQIEHHSVVGLIDRLEERGMIQRITDTVDRRRVNVSLTAEGLRFLSKLSVAHRRELKRIGPKLREVLHRLEDQVSDGNDSQSVRP
jgi:DNA-binding MarR family transcriptional regulator